MSFHVQTTFAAQKIVHLSFAAMINDLDYVSIMGMFSINSIIFLFAEFLAFALRNEFNNKQ